MYLKIDEFDSIRDIPDYYNFEKPYVIRGGCKSMRIFTIKNKLFFFRTMLKNSIIPTEIYNSIEDMESTKVKHKIPKPFSESYDYIVNSTPPYHYIADIDLNFNMHINPELTNYFNYTMDNDRINEGTLLFFGNNSRSGAHIHTGNDYILNQIYGKKTILIFNYYDNPLEMSGIFSERANFLKDNIFKLDPSKFKIYKVVLNEGDSITIPPWWWHGAQADGVSLSITKTYPRSNFFYLFLYPRTLICVIIDYLLELSDNMYNNKDIILLIIAIIILIISYYYTRNIDLKNDIK